VSAPLEGVRVVDMTGIVFGPVATQALADWGADVIKVEPPEGDSLRHAGEARHRGMGAIFLNLNRGKRSVALDLAQPAGMDAMRRLLRGADLFVHNVRRAPMARLGLAPADVLAIRPDIVYCTASGYHEGSALAGAPAIDDSIQAATGLAALNADGSGAPRFVPSLVADKTAGLALAGAMLAALVRRLRTGRGGVLDVPMYETLAGFVLLEHLQGHTYEPSTGPAGYRRVTGDGRRLYRARDGWLTMTPYTGPQWRAFLQAVGDPAMADDPRVVDPVQRNRHIEWLYDLVGRGAASRSVDDWLALCRAQGIPAYRVASIDEVATDPALEASGAIARVAHPSEGTVRMLASPGFLDGEPARAGRPAPRLGEHTVEVLRAHGLDDAAIAAMRASGAAVASDEGTPDGGPGARVGAHDGAGADPLAAHRPHRSHRS
jgi:crotonobetainyl-CoA:carnitine CoA-transferase CaiB-like acyl-CoA transferase